MNHNELINTALDFGMSGAAAFPAAELVTDRKFRDG